MFFGLEVKSQQNQAKPLTLTNTLKLSQAVLEPRPANGKKEPVSVVVEYCKKTFILCVLDPNLAWQCPLDLMFEGGSQVKFFIRGNGIVHLTGYEQYDDLDDMSLSLTSDDEFASDDDDIMIEEVEEAPSKKQSLKGSAQKTPNQSNGQALAIKGAKEPAKESAKKNEKAKMNGSNNKISPKKAAALMDTQFPDKSDTSDDDFDEDSDEDDSDDLDIDTEDSDCLEIDSDDVDVDDDDDDDDDDDIDDDDDDDEDDDDDDEDDDSDDYEDDEPMQTGNN